MKAASSFVKLSLLANIVAAIDPGLTEPESHDNSAGCDCYMVSGPDPGYFQYYRFWDFRAVPNDGNNNYTIAPPPVISSENVGNQSITSAFLNTDSFNADWSIQNGVEDSTANVPTVNSASNVYISRNTSDPNRMTYLNLRAYRLPEFASIAEIDSNQENILHSSIRARMRVLPNLNPLIPGNNASHPVAPGACLGLFTYRSDTQESDIEILTQDPTNHVRYSNQPDFDPSTGNTVPGASSDVIMPNNTFWTEWHDHRIDWYDGISRWYVDGVLAVEKALNVPTMPSALVLNLWSDGGEWTGNMSVGANVTVGVQWIESTFNVSGANPTKRAEKKCNLGCRVDDVSNAGHPQVAFDVTSAGSTMRDGRTTVEWPLQVLLVLWLVYLFGKGVV
ncbi:hypothetical protein LTR05_004719 [Lithohypha guttulata]|uniref:GH16 domain-containing protein n=1 Tax=Lithohypha guttulata TaxID=1690604 RepID=A0AAN7T0P6_9EURO|nr:hypothetical protein LTR05_004719 [Lithohypha guttulata]